MKKNCQGIVWNNISFYCGKKNDFVLGVQIQAMDFLYSPI